MKYSATLVCALLSICALGQPCVDPSLIHLDVMCPAIYQPVCGCDGVTYENDCVAQNYGGVTSWTDGECPAGSTCINIGELDFGPCDMVLGFGWNGSSCVSISGCGYTIGDIDYSPQFYTQASLCQQACGNVATDCINQSQIELGYLVDCAGGDFPVCGCDGVTYLNDCLAYYIGGVTTYSLGNCSDSLCQRIPAFVTFGECAMPLGWALTASGCVEMSGCSYYGQNGYDYSNFFFESSYQCENQCLQIVELCVDVNQIDETVICTALWDPVCGCDNITYSNECEATYHGGVTSFTPGECTTGLLTLYRNGMKIYPNPAHDEINLIFENVLCGEVRITDVTGKTVLQYKMNAQQVKLDLNDLQPGIFLIEYIESGSGKKAQRFVKE